MPLIANPKAKGTAPGEEPFDPLSISTWRFELSMEESGKLMSTAKENVRDGEEMVVKVLRAMWLRKKRAREDREAQSRA